MCELKSLDELIRAYSIYDNCITHARTPNFDYRTTWGYTENQVYIRQLDNDCKIFLEKSLEKQKNNDFLKIKLGIIGTYLGGLALLAVLMVKNMN